ncbi:hypothetical protein BH10PSE7_BH10PSE7_36350 [soil metagenome]
MDQATKRDDPGLAHLSGTGAELRQVLAAHFLRDCPHVLEIGGHLRPVTAYLTHHPRSVTVIDPKVIPYESETLGGHPCRVRHIARKYQDVPVDLPVRAYGLALLGYSLKPLGRQGAVGERLFTLIDQALIVILDYAPALPRAAEQVPLLLVRPGMRTVCDIELLLHDPELRDSPYARRRFIVFHSPLSPP